MPNRREPDLGPGLTLLSGADRGFPYPSSAASDEPGAASAASPQFQLYAAGTGTRSGDRAAGGT